MLSPSPVDLTTLYAVKQYQSGDGTVNPVATTDDDTIQRIITWVSRMFMRRTGNYSGPWQLAQQNPWVQPVVLTDVYSGRGTQEFYSRVWPIQSVQGLTINNVAVPGSAGYNSYGYQVSDDGRRVVLMGGSSTTGFFTPSFIVRGNLRGSRWPQFARGTRNIVLQYTAGVAALTVPAELQAIPATGPYTVAVSVQPWLKDGGVAYFEGGAPFTQVFIAPAVGQYYVQAPGLYLFNAADAGAQVQITYIASGCPQDLVLAAIATASYNYRKHARQGLKSETLSGSGGGTISYTDLEIPPEALRTLLDYRRDDVYPL